MLQILQFAFDCFEFAADALVKLSDWEINVFVVPRADVFDLGRQYFYLLLELFVSNLAALYHQINGVLEGFYLILIVCFFAFCQRSQFLEAQDQLFFLCLVALEASHQLFVLFLM